MPENDVSPAEEPKPLPPPNGEAGAEPPKEGPKAPEGEDEENRLVVDEAKGWLSMPKPCAVAGQAAVDVWKRPPGYDTPKEE